MKIISIIPAKRKSIGLPMKNVRKIDGKPLLQYTIETSLASIIDRTIVSTDDKKIANFSRFIGADVPFMRPARLARKTVSNIDVVRHTLDYLDMTESYKPDIVLLLQPTSPLRTVKMINDSIRILQRSDATSVISVKIIKTHPYSSFWRGTKYLRPFKRDFESYRRRQDRAILYYPTGAIFTFWNKTLKKYNSMYGPRIKPLLIEDDSLNADIDSLFDFFIAEMTMRYWKQYTKERITEDNE